MQSETKLLSRVTDYYLSSPDFNGYDSYTLSDTDIDELKNLIRNDLVFIIAENDDINIFINRVNRNRTTEQQIEAISSGCRYAVYPSTKHLTTLSISEEKPFTKMLAQGMEQMHCLYFAVDILENYINDPRYSVQDCGYKGVISSVLTEEQNDELHEEYIQNFGTAYPCNADRDADRAVCVFLRDLSKLNYTAQCKWRGYLLPDQSAFIVNRTFIDTSLYCSWDIPYWIFDCVLEEVKFINVLFKNTGLPPLFLKEYSRNNQEIIGYSILLLPTEKNFNDFILSLEKLIVNNINYDIFNISHGPFHAIERKDKDGNNKGSLVMLNEWIQHNYYAHNNKGYEIFESVVIKPLKEIRKLRQTPAHRIYTNHYDRSLYHKQNEIMINLYNALDTIRLIMSEYPCNKEVDVPEMISDRNNIVLY